MDVHTIAIIGGTGREGRGLALRWASAGYKILIGSRDAEKASKAADEINRRLGIQTIIGMENADAVKIAELCVLTVIQAAHQQVLEYLQPVLSGKILVDATSQVDFNDPLPPDSPSAAMRAQTILGDSIKVVAAFQNIPARSLGKNVGQLLDIDVLVCSDDAQAAETVIQLVQAAGLHGYYAGKLHNSIVIEGLTSILISLNKQYGVKDTSIKITGLP